MENLESSLNESENRSARLRNLGFLFHFGGEIAGGIGCGVSATKLVFSDRLDLRWMSLGILAYVITQPIAVHLGGIAMDKDELYEKMKIYSNNAREYKRKRKHVRSFLDRQTYRLAKYYYNLN